MEARGSWVDFRGLMDILGKEGATIWPCKEGFSCTP